MTLHYKRFGEGQPLLILHGLMGMLDNWKTPAQDLAQHFMVYIIDQRNHGHSPHSDTFNYEEMADDLLEFIEEHQLNNPIILGHSMGGKTAMKFALQYPDMMHKLVIADIGPHAYPIHHEQILKGLLAVDLSITKRRGEAESVLSKYIPESGVRQFLLKNLYWIERGQLAWRFNLDSINKNIENIGAAIYDSPFEQCTHPTLFIKGGLSDYLPNSLETLSPFFPNSILKTIDNAGHWVHADKPKEFIKMVLQFAKSP